LKLTGQVTLSGPISIAAEGMMRTGAAEQEALAAAVREHARFVFKVAYSVLRNAADAEDAVQETFLRAMRHAREFAAVDDPRAWLARTAWRIAIDRRRRRPEPSLDDAANAALLAELREREERGAGREAAEAGAEATVISGQMLALVQSLIAKLPAKLRDVLTLSTVEEMNSKQIAAVLGIPEGSVRTRLLRARQLLKEKLNARLAEPRPKAEMPYER
jgi:RNA polymerase sigma-70 factor (ECF subfamily)